MAEKETNSLQDRYDQAHTAMSEYNSKLASGSESAGELSQLAQFVQIALMQLNLNLEGAAGDEPINIINDQGQEVSVMAESLKPMIEDGARYIAAQIKTHDQASIAEKPSYVDPKNEDVGQLQSRLKILAAGTGDDYSKLDPKQVDGLHGGNTTSAIQAYAEKYNINELDFSTAQGRADAVKAVNIDIEKRMNNDPDLQSTMGNGLTKLCVEPDKHSVSSVANVLGELGYDNIEEFKLADAPNIKEHFERASGLITVAPAMQPVKLETHFEIGGVKVPVISGEFNEAVHATENTADKVAENTYKAGDIIKDIDQDALASELGANVVDIKGPS